MVETLENDRFRHWVGKVVTRLGQLGHQLVDLGHFEEAISCFETLSWGDDTYENGDYAYGLGRAFEGKGNFVKALDWYRIAHENNPHAPEFGQGIERVTAKILTSGKIIDDGYRLGDYSFSRGCKNEAEGNFQNALVWYRIAAEYNRSVDAFQQAVERVKRNIVEDENL